VRNLILNLLQEKIQNASEPARAPLEGFGQLGPISRTKNPSCSELEVFGQMACAKILELGKGSIDRTKDIISVEGRWWPEYNNLMFA